MCLYLLKMVLIISRNDLNICNEIMESVFIEVNQDQFNGNLLKNVIVGNIYRPPNTNITQFIDCIIQLLDSIKKENKIVYLIGDFNLNLLNAESHHLTSEFLESLYSYSFMTFIYY